MYGIHYCTFVCRSGNYHLPPDSQGGKEGRDFVRALSLASYRLEHHTLADTRLDSGDDSWISMSRAGDVGVESLSALGCPVVTIARIAEMEKQTEARCYIPNHAVPGNES